MKSDLQALLSRIKRAEGPDRELDRAIYEATSRPPPAGYRLGPTPASYTASVDASLALVERLLPGQALAVGTMKFDPPGVPWCCIWTTGGDPKFNGSGATPSLAILAALLTALLAKEP